MATQTGLQIQTEPYLETRKLVVELDSLTGQIALDTLAELNDWRWFSPEKGIIRLTRKRVRMPQTLADLSACMIAALPADYRAFLGVGVAKQDLPRKVFIKPNGEEEVQATFPAFIWWNEDVLYTRLTNLLNTKWKRLHTTLQADVDKTRQAELNAGKTLAWKPLSPTLYADVRDVILLNIVFNACGHDILFSRTACVPFKPILIRQNSAFPTATASKSVP